ncbi:hypothetical protein CDIK_1939 [Cucumispora dikerogammari]|nr:hypothetical protein CDIK_1939 [Cucumispora dikerogammari]
MNSKINKKIYKLNQLFPIHTQTTTTLSHSDTETISNTNILLAVCDTHPPNLSLYNISDYIMILSRQLDYEISRINIIDEKILLLGGGYLEFHNFGGIVDKVNVKKVVDFCVNKSDGRVYCLDASEVGVIDLVKMKGYIAISGATRHASAWNGDSDDLSVGKKPELVSENVAYMQSAVVDSLSNEKHTIFDKLSPVPTYNENCLLYNKRETRMGKLPPVPINNYKYNNNSKIQISKQTNLIYTLPPATPTTINIYDVRTGSPSHILHINTNQQDNICYQFDSFAIKDDGYGLYTMTRDDTKNKICQYDLRRTEKFLVLAENNIYTKDSNLDNNRHWTDLKYKNNSLFWKNSSEIFSLVSDPISDSNINNSVVTLLKSEDEILDYVLFDTHDKKNKNKEWIYVGGEMGVKIFSNI